MKLFHVLHYESKCFDQCGFPNASAAPGFEFLPSPRRLCDLGQVTLSLCASIFFSVKWEHDRLYLAVSLLQELKVLKDEKHLFTLTPGSLQGLRGCLLFEARFLANDDDSLFCS